MSLTEAVPIYTQEYYDRLKEIESRHWWTLGMTDIMDTLLAAHLRPSEGAFFLDIGCGSGIGLKWAAGRLPDARRIGVDISPFGLRHCAGLGARRYLASSERLPLVDSAIDLAICVDVLQHLPDDRPTLKEAARVLKPGGVLFVRTNALSLAPPPSGSRLYTRELLQERLSGAGFTVLRCSHVNFVGSLFAELKEWSKPRAATAHPGAEHARSRSEEAGRFLGGGYGGGLRIEPDRAPGGVQFVKRALLGLEGRAIRRGFRLPFGHSLVTLARKRAH
jgi:ubiquinone/menaquinone biosynthesis C-methylase UbiE